MIVERWVRLPCGHKVCYDARWQDAPSGACEYCKRRQMRDERDPYHNRREPK